MTADGGLLLVLAVVVPFVAVLPDSFSAGATPNESRSPPCYRGSGSPSPSPTRWSIRAIL